MYILYRHKVVNERRQQSQMIDDPVELFCMSERLVSMHTCYLSRNTSFDTFGKLNCYHVHMLKNSIRRQLFFVGHRHSVYDAYALIWHWLHR